MMVIEMRDNAYDTAFELLEEAKHSAKKTKLTLCELEDAMYDCYETSKEEHDDYEYEEPEMEFRSRKGMTMKHTKMKIVWIPAIDAVDVWVDVCVCVVIAWDVLFNCVRGRD